MRSTAEYQRNVVGRKTKPRMGHSRPGNMPRNHVVKNQSTAMVIRGATRATRTRRHMRVCTRRAPKGALAGPRKPGQSLAGLPRQGLDLGIRVVPDGRCPSVMEARPLRVAQPLVDLALAQVGQRNPGEIVAGGE